MQTFINNKQFKGDLIPRYPKNTKTKNYHKIAEEMFINDLKKKEYSLNFNFNYNTEMSSTWNNNFLNIKENSESEMMVHVLKLFFENFRPLTKKTARQNFKPRYYYKSMSTPLKKGDLR